MELAAKTASCLYHILAADFPKESIEYIARMPNMKEDTIDLVSDDNNMDLDSNMEEEVMDAKGYMILEMRNHYNYKLAQQQ